MAKCMDYENKPEDYYSNVRKEMLEYLPPDARRIIDIGCGSGVFGRAIQNKQNAEVWGLELMPKEAREAEKHLDKVFSGPVEDYLEALPKDFFDVIYLNDVLEHLVDPYKVLKSLKNNLTPNGVVISSIPNIRYHNALIKLLVKKDWEYEEFGVMDHTHLRFFTGKSIRRMYEDLGYKVILHEGINKSRSLKPYLYNIPFLFTQLDIRYPQYATIARK